MNPVMRQTQEALSGSDGTGVTGKRSRGADMEPRTTHARKEYEQGALDEATVAADPIRQFAVWYDAAVAAGVPEPEAMTLSTATPDGRPSARIVLLRGFDPRGFCFFTNYESHKGRELAANPHAALCFHWKSLRRQVRVRGPLTPVSAAEADAYFQSRDRGARIGAWASEQSRPLPDRFALEKRVAEFGLKYPLGEVPRPPHWMGWRLAPVSIEFWRDRPFRLHDRLVFSRPDPGAPFEKSRLSP
jgi:pyridoxamine 5'-phosphate oxidase